MPVAATPTGGAEGEVRQQGAQQSQPNQQSQQQQPPPRPATVQDRLKAAMFSSEEPNPDEGRALPRSNAQAAGGDEALGDQNQEAAPRGDANEQQQAGGDADGQQQNASDDQQQPGADGAQDENEATFSSLNELAEGLGWDLDKILDLEASTKIGGKDGKVRLRDLVKSHQLEGHLNQGLMRLSDDRKTFEVETGRKVGEMQARVGQLNQAVSLAQKILDGEYADVNWQDLQRTDPAAFQAKYGAYKMRLDGIQQLNAVVKQENERTDAERQTAYKAYLDEQATLLSSKVPEWADKSKREKDVAEMAAILNESYGITEQELKSCVDHRQILLARDAMAWQKLQKSKPATLNKVRQAPKLIRPGSQQSRAAQDGHDFQKGRDNLRRTGKVQDATPLLKKLIFS